MPTHGNHKLHIRMDEEPKAKFVAAAYNQGTTATDVVKQMIAWWMREPGVELPERPKETGVTPTRKIVTTNRTIRVDEDITTHTVYGSWNVPDVNPMLDPLGARDGEFLGDIIEQNGTFKPFPAGQDIDDDPIDLGTHDAYWRAEGALVRWYEGQAR